NIHISLRKNCYKFGDPLTFHLAATSGPNFILSNTLVHEEIPTKLMTFPSAWAVQYFVFSANLQMLAH
ncbi:hypothetical protein DVA81_18250, partial [Acinetobacter baumannii]